VHGILLLDKPLGITSNRALQVAKRLFNANKAGHTGSLDPAASGMLPLCFGEATKVSGYLLDADKEYEVEMAIGQRTDTADADGQVVETAKRSEITEAQLDDVVARFLGASEQVPPMYSALKKDGRRLYELARQGREVDRDARPVMVHALDIIDFDPVKPRLRVRCSKGTYIRTLVEDMALAMGTLAHVAALRRTAVAPFDGQPMVALAELEAAAGEGKSLDEWLLPVDAALGRFPAMRFSAAETLQLCHGHAVAAAEGVSEGPVRLYGADGQLLGMGEAEGPTVAPKRMFPGLYADAAEPGAGA